MEFDVVSLGVVVGMMVLANRLVAALISPIFEKFDLDKFWLMFASWLLSGVFVGLTGINLFAAYIPSDIFGKILTAVVAGGGANILHDLADQSAGVIIVDLGDKDEAKG